jgi:hypothetical protein
VPHPQVPSADPVSGRWLEKGQGEYREPLVELPFPLIHPQGILGVFGDADITEILAFAEELLSVNLVVNRVKWGSWYIDTTLFSGDTTPFPGTGVKL